MDLKQLVESLALPPDATEAQVLDSILALRKAAGDTALWKARAEDNLSKLEKGQALERENAELKADVYFAKQKAAFKITAAEEVALKKIYMGGQEGEKAVAELIAARSDQEYLTRSLALQNVKDAPTDPYAEVNSRARELMAKDDKLSLGEAESRVLKADYDLRLRYDAQVASGGAR